MAVETVQLLEDSEQLLSLPMVHGIAASVLAAQGDLDDARRHLEAAQEAATATGNVASLLWVVAARARVAIAAGEPAAVIASLQPLADGLRDVGLPEGTQPWRADLVTALVSVGRLDDAARELEDLEARAQSAGPHVRAGLARAAGSLAAAQGADDRAAAAFAVALDADAAAQGELARARLELAAGSFERRRGRRRAAADLLDLALSRFDQIGAAPFADMARRERDACGLGERQDGSLRALTTRRGERRRPRRRRADQPRGSVIARRQREDGRVTPRPNLRQARRALTHRAGDRVAPRRRPRRAVTECRPRP